VIIPSGAYCSQAEKRPSGVNAALAAVLPKPSFFKAATASFRVSYLGAAQLAIWSANCLFIFGKKVLFRRPPGDTAGEALEKSKKTD
jgi:hypothetical protein